MSNSTYLRSEIKSTIGIITLNRPEKHNAFDDVMIAQLIQLLKEMDKQEGVRVVMITAAGAHFCAGADLQWMQRMADFSFEENKKDAEQLMHLLQTLAQLSKPTLALVQGRAMGGGIGLVTCADIVIATQQAEFCFSETKLGLIPATIAPYILRRIGDSATRRYFLTTEIFSAMEAHRIGLVHRIVNEAELYATGIQLAKFITQNAPQATAATKKLLNDLSPIDIATAKKTANLLAEIRSSGECKEGIQAFLEKRKANWFIHD